MMMWRRFAAMGFGGEGIGMTGRIDVSKWLGEERILVGLVLLLLALCNYSAAGGIRTTRQICRLHF